MGLDRPEPALGDVEVARADVERRAFHEQTDPVEVLVFVGASTVGHVAPVTAILMISALASFCGQMLLPPPPPVPHTEPVSVKLVELREIAPPPPPEPEPERELVKGSAGGGVALETLGSKKATKGTKATKRRGKRSAEDERFAILGALSGGSEIGMIGILKSDDSAAMGALFGSEIGEARGYGGLGLSGAGTGTVGRIGGVGLGSIGSIGGVGVVGRIGGGPSVRIEDLEVSGSIERSVVERLTRARVLPKVRGCYRPALVRRPGLAGRMAFRFQIGEDGRARSAEATGGDLGDPELSLCILGAVGGATFPAIPAIPAKTGDPTSVRLTFVLAP